MNLYPNNDYDLNLLEKVEVSRFGFELYTMPNYSWKYTDLVFEEMTALLIRQMAKGVEKFIDVGAHYGFYSVLVGISNPNIDILSFEPVPENFNILLKNLAHNNINSECFETAISDNTNKTKFQISKQSSQSGFIANPDEEVLREIIVNVDILDNYLDTIPDKPILIKIDTEGNESKVLQGMKRLIENRSKIRLIIEFNPTCLVANGIEPNLFLNQITELGFDIFIIDDVNLCFKKYIPNSNYIQYMGDRTYRNLYCIKKEKSLNLCFFSHDSGLLGAQRSLYEIVKKLIQNKGIISTIILPENGPLKEKLISIGSSVIINRYGWWCSFNPINFDSVNSTFINSAIEIKNLLKRITKLCPDVIISNSIVFPWGAISAMLLGKPHIWYVREYGKLDHGLNFYLPFEKSLEIIKDSSNHIIINSEAVLQEYYLDLPDNKRTVAYNQIEMKPLTSKNMKIFTYKDSLKLIFIGQISENKGINDAIEAIISLIEEEFDVELCILGNYQTEFGRKLMESIKIKGLSTRIHFPGFVDEVDGFIKEADILLMCSRNEAFGRVTVEAMLLKKPVIGTNTGGTTELIEDNIDGLLYKPGNVNELKQKIRYFIDNPKKIELFGEKASINIRKKLSEKPADKILYNISKAVKGQLNPMSNNLLDLTKTILLKTFNHYESSIQKKVQIIRELDDTLKLEQKKNEKRINNLRLQLSEKEKEINDLKLELYQTKKTNSQLNQEILFYSLSKSWMITRPLRKFMKIFTRGKNDF